MMLEDVERLHIVRVLERCGWRVRGGGAEYARDAAVDARDGDGEARDPTPQLKNRDTGAEPRHSGGPYPPADVCLPGRPLQLLDLAPIPQEHWLMASLLLTTSRARR